MRAAAGLMHRLPRMPRVALVLALGGAFVIAGSLSWDARWPGGVLTLSGAVAALAFLAFPWGRLRGVTLALVIVLVARAVLLLAPDALALLLGNPRPHHVGMDPFLRSALSLLGATLVAHVTMLALARAPRPDGGSRSP